MKIFILIFINSSSETKRMCTDDVDKIYKSNKSNTSKSVYSQNDFQPIHNNSKSLNAKELLNFLDSIDFVEPSNEELNKVSLITLNSNVIDETLKSDTIFDFKNKNSDYKTSEKIINSKDDKIEVNEHNPQLSIKKHNAKRLKQLCMLENDPNIEISRFYDLRLKYLKNPLSTFKNKIENYIFENIPDSYVLTHVKRLRDIDKICVIFDNNNLECDKYFSIFNISYDAIFCDRLKQINSRFNKDLKFSLKTCDVFLAQFNALIYHSFEANELREKLEILPYFQKYLFFYYELMKLYKYIYEIPELLTIGGLFSERSFSNVIFLMHQINLFCEIFENIKDHRIFILCMIYKTYSCQNEKNGLDIFSIPNYEFKCATTSHDLYYFLWEFNSYKRRDIKVRRNTAFYYIPKDHIFFKTTLLIFLYQHSIFIKYYNLSVEEIEAFREFSDKVLASRDCYACILNLYLNIVRNYLKKVF